MSIRANIYIYIYMYVGTKLATAIEVLRPIMYTAHGAGTVVPYHGIYLYIYNIVCV